MSLQNCVIVACGTQKGNFWRISWPDRS